MKTPAYATDDRLTWAARGLAAFLADKPYGVTVDFLIQQTAGSIKHSRRDSVRKTLNELIACGYVEVVNFRNEGTFDGLAYVLTAKDVTL